MEQLECLQIFNPVLLKQAFNGEKAFCIDEDVDIEGRKGMIRHSFSKDGEALLEVKIDGTVLASIRMNGKSLSVQGLDEIFRCLNKSCRAEKSLEDFC